MKALRILGVLSIIVVLATVLAGVALAQGPQDDADGVRDLDGTGQGLGRGFAYGFVDENGDGINDRYGSDSFVDEDGDGVCDVCGGVPGEGGQMYGGNRQNGQGGGQACDDCGNAQGYGPGQGRGTVLRQMNRDGTGDCDAQGTGAGQGLRGNAASQGQGRRGK